MTDSEDGRIYEYSESCKNMLKFNKQFSQDGIIKKIDDLVDQFNFKEFKKER